MILNFNNSIDQKHSENSKNEDKRVDEYQGGSTTEFETAFSGTELENDFEIKEVEKLEFELDKDNTFSEDILALLQTPSTDIAFIDIFCFEATATEKPVPIRFKVTLTDAGGSIILGDMSHFSLMNIKGLLLTGITINTVVVPDVANEDPKKAMLLITVGSKNKN